MSPNNAKNFDKQLYKYISIEFPWNVLKYLHDSIKNKAANAYIRHYLKILAQLITIREATL